MNPQMNYTPQQVMGHDSYSVPCRVGNWAEDEYMGALLTADHMARSEKGMLMTQKLESTLGSALAPAELSVLHPDGNVHFGDQIMLSNAPGGVLATNPQVREQLSQHAFATSRTMVERPCRRTCFRVVPHSAAAPEDGLLRFGMPFGLVAVGDNGEELHLQSMRYTMANMNFSRSVRGAERKNGVNMGVEPSWQTAWEVVLIDPQELAQLRSEGMPVPANTYVALRHKSSQANLCSDSCSMRNQYGLEYEVSGFTDCEVTKGSWGVRNSRGVGASNHWAFTTAAPAEPAADAATAEPAAEPAAESA